MVRMTPLWTRTGSTTRPWFSAKLPGAAFFLWPGVPGVEGWEQSWAKYF